MTRIKNTLLSILSGLLLAFAWPETPGITFLIFFALVPLLIVEHNLSKASQNNSVSVFLHSYLTFFVFNLITTWWIYYASLPGAIMAIVFNSFFMAAVFFFFHLVKTRVGKKEGYIGLVILWIAFEYLHLNWELSWSWLTFGNAFANTPDWIQWYEYTGHLGGSLWILVVNLVVFFIFRNIALLKQNMMQQVGLIVFLLMILVGPMIWSLQLFDKYAESLDPVEVVVVQPNIDPYNEKFGGISESDQIDRIFDLAEREVDENTDYIVAPETSFPANYWEHELDFIYGTERARETIKKFPRVTFVGGLSTAKLYTEGEEYPYTARSFGKESPGRYDIYNAALQIDSTPNIPLHRKSKLVLGVEKLPFRKYLSFIDKFSIKLGGATGSLGYQEHPTNFESTEHTVIAPVICYESVYPEYVGEYISQGAELIFIITNDGWWDNTAGYRQHLAYARILAISYRRSIARSANTGISAFINQKGEVFQKTAWWEQAVIKAQLNKNDTITVYADYGDIIGRSAAFIAPLLLLLAFVRKLSAK